jgi:hypothetical protein
MHVSRTKVAASFTLLRRAGTHTSPIFFGPRLSSAAFHAAPRPGHESYLTFPARLSRNTPCSPNMFQNHQGKFTRSGRP